MKQSKINDTVGDVSSHESPAAVPAKCPPGVSNAFPQVIRDNSFSEEVAGASSLV